jgi:hypothetical protein
VALGTAEMRSCSMLSSARALRTQPSRNQTKRAALIISWGTDGHRKKMVQSASPLAITCMSSVQRAAVSSLGCSPSLRAHSA